MSCVTRKFESNRIETTQAMEGFYLVKHCVVCDEGDFLAHGDPAEPISDNDLQTQSNRIRCWTNTWLDQGLRGSGGKDGSFLQ